MKAFNFPNMLNNTTSDIIDDEYQATATNLRDLLLSDKYSLLGDPYYGTNLKRLLYSQNNVLLKDMIIDDIFDAIVTFMPQLRLSRNDIIVTQDGMSLRVSINAVNMIDYTNNLYEINLTETTE